METDKDIRLWKRQFMTYYTIDQYRELIEFFYQAADEVLKGVDELYASCVKLWDDIEKVLAGTMKEKDVETRLTIHIKIDFDRASELLAGIFGLD